MNVRGNVLLRNLGLVLILIFASALTFPPVAVKGQGMFDYSLAVSPSSVSVCLGTPSETITVTATLSAGTTEPVILSLSGLPTGITPSTITPNPVTPIIAGATSTFTLILAPSAPVLSGVTVTITGTSTSSLVRTTTFTLSVVDCFDYSLSVAPTFVTLVQGTTSAASTVSVLLLVGVAQPVTLSISGLPTGVTASALTPNPVTPASPAATSTFSLTASATAPVVAGVTITITGTSIGGLVRTTTFTLIFPPIFDYSLSVAPTSVTLVPGTTSAASTVSALLVAGTSQPVSLSISGLPTGVTASAFTPNPVTPASPAATSTFTLTAASTAPVVSGVTLTITGTSTGGVVRTTTFTLNGCLAAFDYGLSIVSTSVTLVQGTTSPASTVSALLVAAGCGVQLVTIGISGLPTGVTASTFTPNPVTPASPAATSTFTLTATATAPVVSGVTVTITGTSTGGIIRTTTFLLNVAPGITSVDFQPTMTFAGNTTFASLITGGTAPFTCTWSFGDLTGVATGCILAHSYVSAGNFTVTLNVADSAGSTATVTHTVVVEPAPFLSKRFKFHDDSNWVKGENFTAIVTNPSAITVTVTVSIDIFDEGAGLFVAHLTGSAVLAPGQVATITIHWSPPPVPADYAFIAKLTFTNGSFVTGTIATRTGLFQISSP